jgi:glycine betaine/proline transport system ATP-binding protein
MVFQSFALMPHMTVLDNAAFGLAISGVGEQERYRRAREALAQVGLAGREYSYPHQLSGGMQQRVGLARALANDPSILLMDEAFSALDPLIRTEMQDQLIRLQAQHQRTIIFISHDLDEAIRIGTRIAIMEGGRVVQVGTPQELLNNPANAYVETFFKNVDSSKVLRAGDVARFESDCVVRQANGSPVDVQPRPYAYVTDNDRRFICLLDGSGIAPGEAPRKLAPSELRVVECDTPLHDILHLAASVPYPLPVLTRDGALHGTISKDALLKTLSRH